MIPKKVFFTKGVGVHKEKLASFELALRSAGLAYCNLVLVSSIYPPGCKRISKEEGTKLLRPGEIVFCVYDRESTNEPNRLVAASVGVAIPADQEQHGYLSEHHSFGETEEKAGEYAEDLAASMLRPHSASNLIPIRLGTNGKICSKCPVKSSAPQISRSPPSATKRVCGRRSSPPALSSTKTASNPAAQEARLGSLRRLSTTQPSLAVLQNLYVSASATSLLHCVSFQPVHSPARRHTQR